MKPERGLTSPAEVLSPDLVATKNVEAVKEDEWPPHFLQRMKSGPSALRRDWGFPLKLQQ